MTTDIKVNQVRTRTRDWASLVRLADPDRQRKIRNTLEYEFAKRKFYANVDARGPYTEE